MIKSSAPQEEFIEHHRVHDMMRTERTVALGTAANATELVISD
jgi:hypothetical protein